MSKLSKQEKRILALAAAFALTFGIVPNVSAMHIMEGYLPGGFCIAWGVFVSAVFDRRIFIHKENFKRTPESDHTSGYVRSFHLRDLFPEDPFSNRKLFSHDRYRTGRYFVRSVRSLHPGTDRSFVPGYPAGSRRPYYYRRQHLFHGYRRSFCLLRNLHFMQKGPE